MGAGAAGQKIVLQESSQGHGAMQGGVLLNGRMCLWDVFF